MTWLWVIIVVVVIGAIIGLVASKRGEEKEGAAAGALMGALGCGGIILEIFLAILGIWVLFKVGSWLFG